MSEQVNQRPILVDPVDDKGYFRVPEANFTPQDEVRWTKRRMDSIRVAQYADSKCGIPNTFDKTGANLCGGRKDGTSPSCNKLVNIQSKECVIRIEEITKPHNQGCAFYEIPNAGDPEGRYCPEGKLTDEHIGFGETDNPLGFGCVRCWKAKQMPQPDSEGRTGWCIQKGHPIEKKENQSGCCWDQEEKPNEEYEETEEYDEDGLREQIKGLAAKSMGELRFLAKRAGLTADEPRKQLIAKLIAHKN